MKQVNKILITLCFSILISTGFCSNVTISGNVESGSFQPNQIKNINLWFDGADEGSFQFREGTNYISQWNDKSGNNHHARAASEALQPLYVEGYLNGRNCVKYDYTDGLVTIDNCSQINDTPYEIFVVMITNNNNTTEGGYIVCGLNANYKELFYRIYEGYFITDWYALSIGYGEPLSVVSNNTWYILNSSYENPLAYHYINGSLVCKVTPGVVRETTNSQWVIGNGVHVGIEYYFAEVIIYNRKLTDIERTQVTNYLSNKWGI